MMTSTTSASSASVRSGPSLTSSRRRRLISSCSRCRCACNWVSNASSPLGPCRSRSPGRVRKAHVDRQVVGVRREILQQFEIVKDRLLRRGILVPANVDANDAACSASQRVGIPAGLALWGSADHVHHPTALRPRVQPPLNVGGATTGVSVTIDESLIVGELETRTSWDCRAAAGG